MAKSTKIMPVSAKIKGTEWADAVRTCDIIIPLPESNRIRILDTFLDVVIPIPIPL